MTEVSGLSELLAMPVPRPLTVDDLFRLPDDGWRYELVDGSLIVSPPPGAVHQRTASRLGRLLEPLMPPGMEVLHGGAGLELDDSTLLVPDLVVVRSDSAFDEEVLRPEDVLLAVEVVSPSNARNDLVLKRSLYASAAIADYWILDGRTGPRITVMSLDAGGRRYDAVHEIGPGQSVMLTDPFPVTLTPEELLR